MYLVFGASALSMFQLLAGPISINFHSAANSFGKDCPNPSCIGQILSGNTNASPLPRNFRGWVQIPMCRSPWSDGQESGKRPLDTSRIFVYLFSFRLPVHFSSLSQSLARRI
ncbi:hypothetical protein B0H11DRAFT_2012967 [Mycena galericulata]|nr:hypothetical protein B0H11DRAFT_2012967 [Mycena galericulata]